MPKVSVIIPTHNRADLLRGAIASVLGQTFRDLELLVIDDASEDHTAQVALSFSDTRVRFIRHESPAGGGAARNTGIRNTGGDYVAFLDDDDEWYPEKLALQVAILDRSPARLGLVFTGYDVVDEADGRILGTRIPTLSGQLHQRLLASNAIGGTSLIMVRREALVAVGGFDETLASYQDYDLYLRLSENYEFDCVPKALSLYRKHEVQIWKHPDALRQGITKMLKKHGHFRIFQKTMATHYLNLSRRYFEAGSPVQSRDVLRRSLALNPLSFRPYGYYALTFLGSNGFKRASQLKAHFSTRDTKARSRRR